MSDDDTIIKQRIRGRSVRSIAKAQRVSVAQINEAIDRWTELAIDDKIRKTTLALELARFDELPQVFYQRALEGDEALVKIIERRGVMLSLHTPQTAVLQIVVSAAPKETSTDRIEAALNALLLEGQRTIRPPIDRCWRARRRRWRGH